MDTIANSLLNATIVLNSFSYWLCWQQYSNVYIFPVMCHWSCIFLVMRVISNNICSVLYTSVIFLCSPCRYVHKRITCFFHCIQSTVLTTLKTSLSYCSLSVYLALFFHWNAVYQSLSPPLFQRHHLKRKGQMRLGIYSSILEYSLNVHEDACV